MHVYNYVCKMLIIVKLHAVLHVHVPVAVRYITITNTLFSSRCHQINPFQDNQHLTNSNHIINNITKSNAHYNYYYNDYLSSYLY